MHVKNHQHRKEKELQGMEFAFNSAHSETQLSLRWSFETWNILITLHQKNSSLISDKLEKAQFDLSHIFDPL